MYRKIKRWWTLNGCRGKDTLCKQIGGTAELSFYSNPVCTRIAMFIKMFLKMVQKNLITGHHFQVGLKMLKSTYTCYETLSGVSNLWPVGHMQPRMAMNMVQHKTVNLLQILWDFFVILCRNVFNVCPKKTLLLPVCCRDSRRLDTPA